MCSKTTFKGKENGSIVFFRNVNRGRREVHVNLELVQSLELRQLSKLAPAVEQLAKAPLLVSNGKEEVALESKEALLDYLMEAGKRGLSIQRYKGLGEMNPETRTLLQVRLEDEEVAELIFTTLMGDAVEPRRQFIEENALDVKNLDV